MGAHDASNEGTLGLHELRPGQRKKPQGRWCVSLFSKTNHRPPPMPRSQQHHWWQTDSSPHIVQEGSSSCICRLSAFLNARARCIPIAGGYTADCFVYFPSIRTCVCVWSRVHLHSTSSFWTRYNRKRNSFWCGIQTGKLLVGVTRMDKWNPLFQPSQLWTMGLFKSTWSLMTAATPQEDQWAKSQAVSSDHLWRLQERNWCMVAQEGRKGNGLQRSWMSWTGPTPTSGNPPSCISEKPISPAAGQRPNRPQQQHRTQHRRPAELNKVEVQQGWGLWAHKRRIRGLLKIKIPKVV